MSDLRGAVFTDGSTIASTGPIKISDIKENILLKNLIQKIGQFIQQIQS